MERLRKMSRLQKGVVLSWLAMVGFTFSGCEDPQYGGFFVPFNLPPDLNPGGNGDGEAQCFETQFRQPAAQITQIADILFVVDTSVSVDSERMRIAENLVALVKAMPVSLDYQIGVLLAHGRLSAYAGSLYQAAGEPLVLRSSELAVQEIATHLQTKFLRPPRDPYSDGGEEGLFSLLQALSPEGIATIREAGFFRPEVALAVIFVADENDICADYPDGVIPVVDIDGIEGPAFDRDCAGVSPQTVVAALQGLQDGFPLMVAGIVNNDLATVPVGDENEYGYGYMETIALANGFSVDLQTPDFEPGLTDIGNLVTVKLNLITEVNLGANVDVDTLEVFVDGQSVDFEFFPEVQTVHLTDFAGEANSLVEIHYCTL